MSTATTVSRITGYLRVFALAYALGATKTAFFRGANVRLADSYNLANIMPNMIYELAMGGILTSLFIPVFMEYLSRRDKEEAWYVVSNSLNMIFIFAGAVSLLGYIFSFYLVRLMTLTAPVESIRLAVFFFKVFTFQILFYSLATTFTAVLNAHRRFSIPASAPIFNNLTVMATVLLVYLPLSRTNPATALVALAIGTTLGVVVQGLVQIPGLISIGMRYRPVLDFRHPSIVRLAVLAGPIVGYVLSNQVGMTVINNLAFRFKGGITAYQYSMQFFQLPYGIFAVSIATALFPELSEFAAKNAMDSFKKAVSVGIRTTGLIMIPAAALVAVLARPIIGLALQYGNFDVAATRLTAPVLAFFAFGLFPFAVHMFLARAHYSLQDTKTPLKVNAIGVPLNIVLNLIFIQYLGVKGLALGFAITYTFTAVLLFALLRRRLGPLGARQIIVAVLKFLAAAVPAGAVAYAISVAATNLGVSPILTRVLQIVASGTGAAIVYLTLIATFKVEEVSFIKKLVRGLVSR